MIVTNVRFYEDLSFDEYLKLPGYSNSSLKGLNITETPAMRFGTNVHQILLEPAKVERHDQKERAAAKALKASAVGPIIKYGKPELSVTADFEYEGFVFHWKGRIDLAFPDKMVIDFKVSKLDIKKSIDFFRYDRAVAGYCLAIKAPHAFILSVHPEKHSTQIEMVQPDYDFWKIKCLEYGVPM